MAHHSIRFMEVVNVLQDYIALDSTCEKERDAAVDMIADLSQEGLSWVTEQDLDIAGPLVKDGKTLLRFLRRKQHHHQEGESASCQSVHAE